MNRQLTGQRSIGDRRLKGASFSICPLEQWFLTGVTVLTTIPKMDIWCCLETF